MQKNIRKHPIETKDEFFKAHQRNLEKIDEIKKKRSWT